MRRRLPRWFESLTIRGKLGAMVTVQLAVLTVGAVAVMIALHRMGEARAWNEHTYRVIEHVEALRGEVLEQQAGLRGYIITGQPVFLRPFHDGVIGFDDVSVRLQPLIQDNPGQLQRHARLAGLVGEWQSQVAARDIAWMEKAETRHLASEATAAGAGKRRIDAIKRLCDEMIGIERELLGQRAETTGRLEKVLFGLILGLLVLGWLTGLYAVALLNRMIGAPVSRLAELVPRLTTGEAIDVPHMERSDEVGTLAKAFERLRDANADQRRITWVREQAVRVLGALQHCDNDETFGHTLISRLCEALGAAYGLAYRWNEQLAQLEWCAGFGVLDESARRRFKLGEGMVGQCIVERRVLEISPVPAGYLKIVSGLGAALPGAVLFAPLTARGETVAVLELGLLAPLDGARRELLEQVLVNVGLAWQSLSRSTRTRELLDESRAMTEELQSRQESLHIQGEELRAANEALRSRGELLEEQGRRLRVSEEELRAQADELRIANTALEERTGALHARQGELETARADLERKAGDLEQASRYKSEFLANMSHELRTPLNSMLILSKMLAENGDGNLDEEQVESARVVYESGRSLLGLINDILDLSKVEAGKMIVNLGEVRVSDCFGALVDRFRPLPAEQGLQFSTRIAPDAPSGLRTDGTRLVQILTNLLSNAFKFTHAGEIELSAEQAEIGDAPAILLSVRDTGIGIPAEKLARVFEAFEQADSSASRRYGGTGLGLSIVSGMTALLGGHVRVASEEGKGSTFGVLLPLQPAVVAPAPIPILTAAEAPSPPVAGDASGQGPAPDAAAGDADGPPTGPPVLLIVEDDPAFARVLADIAIRRGLEVVLAGTGAEALAAARARRLSGVLLDIGLPDISGWDVLEKLKAGRNTALVPVHIVSGGDEIARGRELGAVGFLRKPVDSEGIVQALERIGAGVSAPPRRRLLLVDQDAASRAAIRALLGPQSAGIVEAASAAEGLAQIAGGSFDGLLLDPDLPDMAGLEFLRRAAALGTLPPVVIHARRELSAEENVSLREYTGSIVIQGARSSERLLDEVHLFLHALDRPGAMPAAHAPIADLVGKTVLVVDDDMRNVFALSKTLRMRGLNVVMAQDGHKALAQLEARPDIDIVLMDIMMPGMDGYETIRRIRAVPQWQQLPIIAVTAKAMMGDREKSLEAGANEYCAKPIDIDQLVSLLQVWA